MPTSGTVPNRRFLLLLVAAVGLVSLLSWAFSGRKNPDAIFRSVPIHQVSVDDDVLKGDAIMGKIGNETIKAELGRAAWKLFHTTMAKFPDKPSQDEQTALFSYIHLFARLYPWCVAERKHLPLQKLTMIKWRMCRPLPPDPQQVPSPGLVSFIRCGLGMPRPQRSQ